MRDCLHARSLVPSGHLLISPGRVPAARRLIARGYLAQIADQPVPFDPKNFGLVVVLEQAHLSKLIDDANSVVKLVRNR